VDWFVVTTIVRDPQYHQWALGDDESFQERAERREVEAHAVRCSVEQA
jgi:hypothetical protein